MTGVHKGMLLKFTEFQTELNVNINYFWTINEPIFRSNLCIVWPHLWIFKKIFLNWTTKNSPTRSDVKFGLRWCLYQNAAEVNRGVRG